MDNDNNPNQQTSQGEKTLGRGMLYVGWVLVLAVLAYVFSDFEKSRQNPNNDQHKLTSGNQEVTLLRNAYDQYLFTGLANGKEIEFLVDTGASSLVFTEKQARELGLRKGFRVTVSTANGETQAYTTELRKLQIGTIMLYDIPAMITPNMDGEALLGMTALSELEWTQRNGELTIRQY